ncbi:hypothetical protein VNI00_006724, partial [Paramarasmius palmivorus]
ILIIVRIALGLSHSSVDEAVSTMRGAEANSQSTVTGTMGTVLDISPDNQPRPGDV